MSFIPALFLPHIGEEGVYTIGSFEMLYSKDFIHATLYGGGYPRPPLYNWCILGVAYILRLQDLLIAARIVSILSTLGMATIVAWLAKKLWQQRFIGILTSSIFLSGDILLRRGWMAYSDPIFAFFVFASMALLWIAVHELCFLWLLLSVLCLFFGFLAKVHTIYIFYGVAWLILFWSYPQQRKFLLSIKSIIIYLLAIIFPWIWIKYIAHSGTIASTVDNIEHLFILDSLMQYIIKIGLYPLELIWRTLPVSIVVLFHIIWKKHKIIANNVFFIAGAIILINLLPYWISPCRSIRYLMPLYPLMAMMFSYIVYTGGESLLRQTITWLMLCVCINYLVMFFWYPYDQTVRKGNAKAIAQEIMSIAKDEPLYINNSGAGGLRVAAELNTLRTNKPPLHYITENYNGYVVVNQLTDLPGILVATYKLGGITVYLKCNGEHCAQGKH